MTSTWHNLICPECGAFPLEEPLAEAVRHELYCSQSSEHEGIFTDIGTALREKHGVTPYIRAVSAAQMKGKPSPPVIADEAESDIQWSTSRGEMVEAVRLAVERGDGTWTGAASVAEALEEVRKNDV